MPPRPDAPIGASLHPSSAPPCPTPSASAPSVGDGFFWWTLDELKFDAAFYGTLRVVLDPHLSLSPTARLLALPGRTLVFTADNDAARAVYERLGWRRDETFVRYALPLREQPGM